MTWEPRPPFRQNDAVPSAFEDATGERIGVASEWRDPAKAAAIAAWIVAAMNAKAAQ